VKKQEVRHFSRGTGPVYPSPLPPAREQYGGRDCFVAVVVPRFCYSTVFARQRCRRRLPLGPRTLGAHHTPTFPPMRYAHSRTWLVHLFNRTLAGPAKCSRPTGFTGPPLLPGAPCPLHPQPAFTSHGGMALGFVSGPLVVTSGFPGCQRTVVCLDPISHSPARKHLRERYLIPAHYSCRSRSPVSSEARDAIPDLTNPPFPSTRLSPGGFCGRVRHASFG